jgi:hypothetical protein
MKWAETCSTKAEAGVMRRNFGLLFEWAAAVVASPPSWTNDDLTGAKLLLAALMIVSGRRGADMRNIKYEFTAAGTVDGERDQQAWAQGLRVQSHSRHLRRG